MPYATRQEDALGLKIALATITEGGNEINLQRVIPQNESGVTIGTATTPMIMEILSSMATLPVSGNVEVDNFPLSFNVGNFPATQVVSGTVTLANPQTSVQVSSGTVSVSSGTVSISNIPAMPNTIVDLASISVSAITSVWTPGSGLKPRFQGGSISLSTSASILFEDNAAGTKILRTPTIPANSPYTFDVGDGKLLASDHIVKATGSTSTSITGYLYGREE